MKKQLFIYITLIVCAGFLGFFTVSVYAVRTNNLSLAREAVMETTQICAGLYADGTDIEAFVNAGNDTRVTVISPDGKVLADSRPLNVSALENHLDRPEIQAAAEGNPEAFVRYSSTLGTDLIYYALKKESGGSYVFIRTAVPAAKINTYLYTAIPQLALLFFIAVIFCFFFTRKMINRITLPFESVESKLRSLSSGGYTPGIDVQSYEEINKLMRGIDDVAGVLQNSFNVLRDEKNKQDYILNNISDGLFVVDENKNIALVNSAALDIFNARPSVTGKHLNYLSYDKTIAAAFDDSVKDGRNALFEIAQNGRIYSTAVKRLPETSLTMVALSDVTESRENAKRREEFFANASHELKTPLTAIRGFNELTAINNKDENIRKYIESIARETDRILSLVSDMLKISELENMREINPVPLSLAKTVSEIGAELSVDISEKSVAFEADGDAAVQAEPGHLYELVKNIVENAVRYNNKGGSVSVKIQNDAKAPRLTVSDNGIGIAPEDQTRIFERFYRVEKSRSPKNGGTGLGLAIVKHICVLYDWKLSLQSRPGAGTEVTVIFGGNNAV